VGHERIQDVSVHHTRGEAVRRGVGFVGVERVVVGTYSLEGVIDFGRDLVFYPPRFSQLFTNSSTVILTNSINPTS
jgi:hypothetical protein